MGDALLPFPLTERSVHLCVDMQRIFSADGPWPAPWMERVPAGPRNDARSVSRVTALIRRPATVQ